HVPQLRADFAHAVPTTSGCPLMCHCLLLTVATDHTEVLVRVSRRATGSSADEWNVSGSSDREEQDRCQVTPLSRITPRCDSDEDRQWALTLTGGSAVGGFTANPSRFSSSTTCPSR